MSPSGAPPPFVPQRSSEAPYGRASSGRLLVGVVRQRRVILTGAAGNLLSTLVNWVWPIHDGASIVFPAGAGASGAVFGIAGAVVQTATQIRESAIAFVPKAVGLMVLVALAGGLMLSVVASYAEHVFREMPAIIHDQRTS